MKSKSIIILFLLFSLTFAQKANAQSVNKSFTNEKEWRLTFKLIDAYHSESFNYCSKCMDEIVGMTTEIDEKTLELGMQCYDKTYQIDKIKNLIRDGYIDNLTLREKCNINLSEKVNYFKDCEGEKLNHPYALYKDVSKPELREQLISMLISDQYNRGLSITNALADLGYEVYNDYLANNTQSYFDTVNLIALKEIISTNGFPTKKEVGLWGMTSVFLIIQHSNIEFQLKHKPDIDNALKNKEISSANYATMIDRMEINQEKPQIYGTHSELNEEGKDVFMSMIDPDSVNERRMKVGLMPIERYMVKKGITGFQKPKR